MNLYIAQMVGEYIFGYQFPRNIHTSACEENYAFSENMWKFIRLLKEACNA